MTDDLPPLPVSGSGYTASDMREYARAAIRLHADIKRKRKYEREQLVARIQAERGCTAREARAWLTESHPEMGWRQR